MPHGLTTIGIALSLLAATGSAAAPPTAQAQAAKPKPAAAPAGRAETARAKALRDGWPDTPAGIVAAGWVDAFTRGEGAMRAYLEAHVSKEGLEARPMKVRLAGYLELRERLGELMLGSIEASQPHELTVVLLAEDASRHRFIFKVKREPPHALLQVGMLQHGHGHGGGRGPH